MTARPLNDLSKKIQHVAVRRGLHGCSVGASLTRQLSLQPEANEAVVEVTKRVKPSA